MPSRARILIVSPDAAGPPDQGFRIRVHQLALALARAGRPVTLLAVSPGHGGSGTADAALRTAGVEVVEVEAKRSASGGTGRPGRLRRGLALVQGRPIDTLAARVAVLGPAIERTIQGRAVAAIQVELPELVAAAGGHGLPVVLDAHNIWSELTSRRAALDRSVPRRVLRRLLARRQRATERRAWAAADLCLAVSEREGALLRAEGARAVAVVPNGVALDAGPAPVPALATEPPTLVFVGLLAYGPNRDAVAHLVRDILPLVQARRPRVRVRIVGDGATDELLRLAGPSVEFTGRLDDVRPVVRSADVVVVPLRIGSGTRLKILEGMALGRPVVSTTIGAEGIELVDGRDALIADGAAPVASAILRLLDDPALAARIGAAGRTLVERAYGWDPVGARLAAAYDALLSPVHGG